MTDTDVVVGGVVVRGAVVRGAVVRAAVVRAAVVRGAFVLLAGVAALGSQACTRIVEDPSGTAVSAAEAGPFPEDYEAIIRRWAVRELSRFSVIDTVSAPRPSPGFWERKGIGAGSEYGWVTTAVISGRDRVGMSTGRVNHQILIRDGEVIESRYQP